MYVYVCNVHIHRKHLARAHTHTHTHTGEYRGQARGALRRPRDEPPRTAPGMYSRTIECVLLLHNVFSKPRDQPARAAARVRV